MEHVTRESLGQKRVHGAGGTLHQGRDRSRAQNRRPGAPAGCALSVTVLPSRPPLPAPWAPSSQNTGLFSLPRLSPLPRPSQDLGHQEQDPHTGMRPEPPVQEEAGHTGDLSQEQKQLCRGVVMEKRQCSGGSRATSPGTQGSRDFRGRWGLRGGCSPASPSCPLASHLKLFLDGCCTPPSHPITPALTQDAASPLHVEALQGPPPPAHFPLPFKSW